MRRFVKQDLGLESRIVQLRPLLTPPVKEKRAERAAKLLSRLKNEDKGKVSVFSDEKIFTADVAVNRRNSRYLTAAAARRGWNFPHGGRRTSLWKGDSI
jgi:hypothetical protein